MICRFDIPQTNKKRIKNMPTPREIIDINPVYLITYKTTGKPYIDEERTAHAFLRRTDAEIYLEEKDELARQFGEVTDGRHYRYDEFTGICYSSGAEKIYLQAGTELLNITIGKLPPTRYFNPKLAGTLNLLLTTRKKKYLYELYKRKFIVPIRIDRGIVINYGIARIQDREFFLVFSETDEYGIWASNVEGFEPLELTFKEIQSLSLERDIIINITGSRFLLDKKKIDKIIAEAEAEREEKDVQPVQSV